VEEPAGRTRLPRGAEALHPGDPAALGPYALIGRLGEGGMGVVYLGRNDDGRLAAVKVVRAELAADEGFRTRFRTEVDSARRVASFCTAKVLDHGEQDGRPYMVTEYVDGTPLEDYVEAQGPLPEGTLHGVAVGVAAALTAIHTAGLIHRDLKPSNVLLSVSGPRVIDFGIARAVDAPSANTRTGFVIGTPGWMAPEQVLSGDVSTAADVFAWGCLVAFSGTGRHPHGTGSVVTLAARATKGEYDLTGLSGPLRVLVERALDPDPGRRPDAQRLLLELVGGATPAEVSPNAAQAVATKQLTLNWEPQALPPPWIPPSSPQSVRVPAQPYGMTPAPMPPPVQQVRWAPPAPYAPPRRSRSRWGCGCVAALLLLVVAVAIAGYFLTMPTDGQRNRPAADGQFSFVVSSVSCGGPVRGLVQATGDKFCRVRITVTNVGSRTRTLSHDAQKLLDENDHGYRARALVKGTSPDMRNRVPLLRLSPRARFTGLLIFEIPTGLRATAVVLHDARLSRGVRVPAGS
jgi:serine/threonine protein kinase